jgi:pimeloyl-ACP methyl ester carboxylesterase
MDVLGQRHEVVTVVGPLAVRVRGAGPTAVLWHSLFVDERSWSRVESDLARVRRLVIITGPGHGSSGDPGRRYSLDDCAAAALTVLEAVGASGPVDWVGNAWGGHVGIAFASSWPSRCRTLATFGTPVQSLSPIERARTSLLLAAYRLVGPAAFLRSAVVDAMLSENSRHDDDDAIAQIAQTLNTRDRRALRNAIVSISIRRPDLTERLPAISASTLFVTGNDHPTWTAERAQAASRLLPHGTAAAVPDSSYLIPLEDPAATVRLLNHLWND